jgi:two-component system repressor protein LuxO
MVDACARGTRKTRTRIHPWLSSPPSHGETIHDDSPASGLYGLIGGSSAMREVYSQIKYLGSSRANVFIMGENGTGKLACAEAIHRASPRSSAPFVTVSCHAMAPEQIERHIFGDPAADVTASSGLSPAGGRPRHLVS